MPSDPISHHRRSIRLPGYDYSQPGAYFITMVVKDRMPVLGTIFNNEIYLGEFGKIVESCWISIPRHFPTVGCDCFVVMPNHFHGILELDVTDTQQLPVLGQVIGYFKYQSTQAVNQKRGTPGSPLWQRNYYEHIIRNEDDYRNIYDYIRYNPLRWKDDSLLKTP